MGRRLANEMKVSPSTGKRLNQPKGERDGLRNSSALVEKSAAELLSTSYFVFGGLRRELELGARSVAFSSRVTRSQLRGGPRFCPDGPVAAMPHELFAELSWPLYFMAVSPSSLQPLKFNEGLPLGSGAGTSLHRFLLLTRSS